MITLEQVKTLINGLKQVIPGRGELSKACEDIGAIPVPAKAEVGQMLVVDEIDSSGRPIAWHTTDMPKEIAIVKYNGSRLDHTYAEICDMMAQDLVVLVQLDLNTLSSAGVLMGDLIFWNTLIDAHALGLNSIVSSTMYVGGDNVPQLVDTIVPAVHKGQLGQVLTVTDVDPSDGRVLEWSATYAGIPLVELDTPYPTEGSSVPLSAHDNDLLNIAINFKRSIELRLKLSALDNTIISTVFTPVYISDVHTKYITDLVGLELSVYTIDGVTWYFAD